MSLIRPDFDYQVTSFAAGFLDTPEPKRLPIGACWQGKNAFFYSSSADGRSSMGKRPGCRLITTNAVSLGDKFDGLYEFRRESATDGELLGACNGDVLSWDNVDTFAVVAAGFTAGQPLRATTFRNLALLMDGTHMQAYDGATSFDVGFAAPTAAPGLAAVVPVGAGVTGTYQSLAVFYDSVHDHESSPSAKSVATAFAAQDRRHTRPAGVAATNVDKWRVYVRRTDTNEVYFKRVAEVAIGTANINEAVTDDVRNLASTGVAPLPNQNDQPPTFALATVAQGYVLGVPPDSSDVHVSALGDPQGYHPADVLSVAKGEGKNLTTIKTVGTLIVAQKARRTYQLKGDRMPFIPDELEGSFGNHSQDSSIEAASRYWGWDDEKGPYKTDLATEWTSLVDGRVRNFVKSVNRTAEIRCVHYKDQSLVAWVVSTDSTGRTRSMLAYNYLLDAWLPPITGIEIGAIVTFQLPDGSVNVYVGDYWGRFFQYFIDDVEGVPSGSLRAPVSSATANTVTATVDSDGAPIAFFTTDDGLAGLPVAVIDSSGVFLQWRTIESNTAGTITLDTTHGQAWDVIPDTSYEIVVGGIDWLWSLPLIDYQLPMVQKRGGFLYAEMRSNSGDTTLYVRCRLNDVAAGYETEDDFMTPQQGGVWGSGVWGTMIWGAANTGGSKKRLQRSFFALQCDLSNPYPDQPIQLTTFGVSADRLPSRWWR